MNSSRERYWINAQIDNQKEFAKEQEHIKNLKLDLWKSIITIQAAILGISIPLLGYVGANPNLFLISTWTLEIASIALGFLLFKIHIDKEFTSSLENFKFSMDMNEISAADARSEFIGKEEKKQGLIITALMNMTPKKEQSMFSDYAKDLAKKYKSELRSAKLFKEVKKTKVYKLTEFLLKNQTRIVNAFYCLSAVSFLTLLLGILTK